MKAVSPLTRAELKAWLDSGRDFILIDVLTPEAYAEAHLPKAQNACIYDVTFLDQVEKLVTKKDKSVVLYGAGHRDLSSTTAAEKLIAAGYGEVYNYRGGLEDWDEAPQIKADPTRDGLYNINLEKSQIDWTGRNITGSHTGILKMAGGFIIVENDSAASGVFTINMASMLNRDLPDGAMQQMLISHLQSEDFFNVPRFPTAEFHLGQIEKLREIAPGNPNCKVSGTLTIKDISHPITFDAIISPIGVGLAAEAHFDIDRTQWKVLYGSGKFYEKLGKHLVYDNITIGLKIFTHPPE